MNVNQTTFPQKLVPFLPPQQALCTNSTSNYTTNNQQAFNINHTNTIKESDLAQMSCDPSDIYCLCKFHPRYKDCVCLAYPKSVVCSITYCKQNPNTYECNPQFCDKNPSESNCFCRENIEDIRCKCKLNPVNKECFCLKYPFSHICNDRICKFNPNSLFCKCESKPDDVICSPKFCAENPMHAQCECIMDPMNSNCKCLNDPNSCPKENVVKDVIEYDTKIRLLCSNQTDPNHDNKTLFEQYYPPCVYEEQKPKNAPCLPYPPPPKPCNKTLLSNLRRARNNTEGCKEDSNQSSAEDRIVYESLPCLQDPEGAPCVQIRQEMELKKKQNNFAYNMVNVPSNHTCSGNQNSNPSERKN